MADVVSKAKRSEMMAGIRGKDTRPELIIRRGLHAMGYRFRVHRRDLPGNPDIVLPKYRAVIFVHGCFWHGHDCHLFKWPKTREAFWREKIGRNSSRDAEARQMLESGGWRVLTVWECALRGSTSQTIEELIMQIIVWLRGGRSGVEIRANVSRRTSKYIIR